MDPPGSYVPAGPEAAPTMVQSASRTLTTGSTPSIGGLSTASAACLATLLPFIGLLLAAFVIWKVRRRRRKSDASDEFSVEKSDEEAQPPTRPVITVITPQASVCWQPQIRSISGPGPKETEKRVPPPPRRARSPPPTRTYNAKNRDPFADPCPRSAPASAVSFSEDSLRSPPWQKGFREETSSHSVLPHALAVSGMQTRSLARPSQLSNNVDA